MSLRSRIALVATALVLAAVLVNTLLQGLAARWAVLEEARENGDGIAESFRLEVVQVLVGFETLTLPRGSAETAHFRSTTTLTVSPSLLANPLATLATNAIASMRAMQQQQQAQGQQ